MKSFNEVMSISLKEKEFNDLMKFIQKDPERGLNVFYKIYGEIIFYTIKSMCKRDYQIREVTSNVLIKIWRSSSKVRNIHNPEGWVYVITINCVKDVLKIRADLPLYDNYAKMEDKIDEIINLDSFFTTIKDLSPIEQQIIILRIKDKETFNEIAEKLNKPIGSITAKYYRALEKIKKNLEKNKKF